MLKSGTALRKTANRYTHETMNDDSLLRYWRGPSARNFERLVRETQYHVHMIVSDHLRGADLCADVVQEVYTSVVRRVRARQKQPPDGFASLHRMAREMSKKRATREFNLAAHVEFQPELPDVAIMETLPREDIEEVRRAIEELPPSERECIWLRFFADLGTNATAELLGVPQRTVQDRFRRGCERLKPRLAARIAPLVITALLSPSDLMASPVPALPGAVAARLDRLIRAHPEQLLEVEDATPKSQTTRAASTSSGSIAAIATLLLACAALIAWLVFSSGGEEPQVAGDRSGDDDALVAMNDEADADDPGAVGEMVAPVRVAAGDEAPPSAGDRAPGGGRTPKSEPEEKKEEPAPDTIEVLIVDMEQRPVEFATVVVLGPGEVPTSARPLIAEGAAADVIEMAELAGDSSLRVEMPAGLAPGALCTVIVQADGYPWRESYRFDPAAADDSKVLVILDSDPVSTLTVRDAVTGDAIEGAVASASTPVEGPERVQVIRSTASARGECTFRGHLLSPYEVEVSAWGYGTVSLREVRLGETKEIWLQPAAVEPNASIAVYVYDARGEPWEGAPVTCSSPAGVLEVSTDKHGRGEFGALTPGVYVLGTEPAEGARGNFLLFTQLPVGEHESRVAYLGAAPPAALTVMVADHRFRPLGNVGVVLDGMRTVRARTDGASGRARIEQLSPGFYEVLLPGVTQWRVEGGWLLPPGSEEQHTVILGSRTVRGRIMQSEELRVVACTLTNKEITGRTHVGPDGRFELGRVATRKYLFDLELNGSPHRLWRRVEVDESGWGRPDDDIVDLELPFDALCILEIDVGTMDGQPLDGGGAEIEVGCHPVNDKANAGKLAPLGAGLRSVVYGALVPAGRHDVRVRVGGRTVWRERIEVEAGARVRREARVE